MTEAGCGWAGGGKASRRLAGQHATGGHASRTFEEGAPTQT